MDRQDVKQFRIPISLPSASILDKDKGSYSEPQDILDAGLGASRPTVLERWNWPGFGGVDDCRIVIGCQDGTVYVLHHPPEFPSNVQPLESNEPSRQKNPKRNPKSSESNSRSTSPTIASFPLSPTFNVTGKPRVVSGITVEQVEAPKNYVDFDDEPDKLKDILKGKNPRDRSTVSTMSDTGSERTPKSNAPSIVESVPAHKRRNAAPRSLLSAANSRAPTPPSFSDPASPAESPLYSLNQSRPWKLKYHIIPSQSGFGHSVKSLQPVYDGQFFVTLQESGYLHVYSSDDGICKISIHVEDWSFSGDRRNDQPSSRDIWLWSNLSISYVGESAILVAVATNVGETSALTIDIEERASETSRRAIFEFTSTPAGVKLTKLGQWDIDGPALDGELHVEVDGAMTFLFTNHEGHFMTREFTMASTPLPVLNPPNRNEHGGKHSHGLHLPSLPLPHGFKSIMSRSSEHLPSHEKGNYDTVNESAASLSESHDIGILLGDTSLCGLKTRHCENGKLQGVAWNHKLMTIFEYVDRSLKCLFHHSAIGVQDAAWLSDEAYALCFEDHVIVYRAKFVNADNDDIRASDVTKSVVSVQPELIRSIHTGRYDTIKCTHGLITISRYHEDAQRQEIVSYSIPEFQTIQDAADVSQLLWQFINVNPLRPQITLTSMLPLELETIIQGYSDGHLRQFSLAQLARKDETSTLSKFSSIKTSNFPVDGYLVGLHVVQNPRTRDKFIVGGADDGSIIFWSMSTFELVARWIIFTTPLFKVLQFESEKTGPLRGCALCVSRDGTVAVIVVDGFHFLYLVPGSSSPLIRICLGGNNLLLIYGDNRARLWDAQTKELWRSMGQDKAQELLAQGGWAELALEKDACVPKTLWSLITDSYDGQDAAATLSLNLEQLVIDSVSVTKTISTSRDEVREILLTLDRLRIVLSSLLTPGLSNDVDSICYGKLGAHSSSAAIGTNSVRATTLYGVARSQDIWCISETVTATRALAIISVLRAMSLFEELTEGANTVVSFYSVSLATCVGPQFKRPSLEFLGELWFDASNELRSSIRILFDATIASLSDEAAIKVTEKWQHHVPSLQPDAEKETPGAALALLICGCIASEKYSLLSINALMDISKSISLYLHDEKSTYRALAIDLCSRGFHVWQHYIDSMEILRSLFNLATSTRKDSISLQNVGAQARLSVLSIASNNMPLLMGTLCLDILNPPTMEHRRSVLQILAFLIRKRPYVLQPNLPRLMEAVVKSLDPNSTANRELVLDAATEIIGYVVKTFPTVDFHMATQRLAVGTNEGAVVMYDLKTAIRLYVLEGHKKSITASSFSPDGRRLVTVCLKESLVLVWKVGSSFASFFNPGAPPRQGHGGSEPFKTLNFNVGSDAEMTTAETLDQVRVDWIADRSVKVKIRQSVLTFST